jgi:hypothetical protein
MTSLAGCASGFDWLTRLIERKEEPQRAQRSAIHHKGTKHPGKDNLSPLFYTLSRYNTEAGNSRKFQGVRVKMGLTFQTRGD